MNGLTTNNADINIISNGGIGCYSANKQAMDKIKSLSDEEFEKEMVNYDSDTQEFFRIAREH